MLLPSTGKAVRARIQVVLPERRILHDTKRARGYRSIGPSAVRRLAQSDAARARDTLARTPLEPLFCQAVVVYSKHHKWCVRGMDDARCLHAYDMESKNISYIPPIFYLR